MNLVDTFLNGRVFVQTLPLLLSGLTTTLLLGLVSIVLGLAGGLALALMRLYARAPLRQIAIAYIDVFRAIPLLVLLVIVYYALPFMGVRLSPFAAAAATRARRAGGRRRRGAAPRGAHRHGTRPAARAAAVDR